MEPNEFFRDVTLRICGNLALEQALHDTLLYLREHIPIDELYAQYYDPELGKVRVIAHAELSGGRRLERVLSTPFGKPDDAVFEGAAIMGQAVVLNHPDENRVATGLLRFYGRDETATSMLTLRTVRVGDTFGGLIAVAGHRDAFTDAHGKLMTLLAAPFKVALVNAVQHGDLLRLKDRLADDNQFLQRELQRRAGDEIIGAELGLKGVLRLVHQVAPTSSPVLLSGETGVGKDLVATAIHLGSPRREAPFIAVNCGAIPESLLDSELFGHEKGAFTGALARKRGRFERAHGGTIFLDEIGEMPLNAQVRLLRVLQNREVERIGGTGPINVDIRVIAATNKNLEDRVAAGQFREDLWFRLNVFPIEIPPLRERSGDIPALVQHFTARKARELKLGAPPSLAEGALDDLLSYPWPGNVRELENLIERAMIIHRTEPLRFDLGGARRAAPFADGAFAGDGAFLDLDAVVARHIRRALEKCGGKVHGPDGAGALLGMNPSTLRYRMRKLGISAKRD